MTIHIINNDSKLRKLDVKWCSFTHNLFIFAHYNNIVRF